MFRPCEHNSDPEEEIVGPKPEEIAQLQKGECLHCEGRQAHRQGDTWICKCCGMEWQVKSRSITLLIKIRT
jgi:ribosomal protein L37AE/L43A